MRILSLFLTLLAFLPVSLAFTCDEDLNLSDSVINDNFCDCKDGTDEPDTSACPNGVFVCQNKGYIPIKIPSSRVNDGICDCCDGKDEAEGICQDNCLELANVALQAKREAWEKSKVGYTVKLEIMKYYSQVKQQFDKEKSELEGKIVEVERRTEGLSAEKDLAVASLEAEHSKTSSTTVETPEPIVESAKTQPEDTSKDVPEKEEQFFPYPKEYAPPPQDKPNDSVDNSDNAVEEDSYAQDEQSQDEKPDEPSLQQLIERLPETQALNDANSQLNNLKSRLSELNDFLDMNLGKDGEYTLLYEYGKRKWLSETQASIRNIDNSPIDHPTCPTLHSGEYEYELCPFVAVTQKNSQSGNRVAGLGNWVGWDGNVMKYEGGDQCWNGPQRSCLVSLECHHTTQILSVSEPAKCEYSMRLGTPMACDKPGEAPRLDHDEL